MEDNLIVFRDMPWEKPAPGVRSKTYARGSKKLRLVEFSDGFTEKDWCKKGHIGYVLEGKISINYNGKLIKYVQGDGIFIARGEENKHKAVIPKGKKALLILVEQA